jgi:hypothetical protein
LTPTGEMMIVHVNLFDYYFINDDSIYFIIHKYLIFLFCYLCF